MKVKIVAKKNNAIELEEKFDDTTDNSLSQSGVDFNFASLVDRYKIELATVNETHRIQLPSIKTVTPLLNDIKSAKNKQQKILNEKNNEYNTKFNSCVKFFGCCVCCCCGCSEYNTYYSQYIASEKQKLNRINLLQKKVNALNISINNAFFQVKKKWNGGQAVVYNPKTGKAEWKDKWHHGICGVWNPKREEIEWKTLWNGDIHGVWNPNLEIVEWKEKWHHGIGGVYNPITKMVEWKEKWNHGVCGVWNPVKKMVEWKEKWNGGVVGYWDENKQQVVWIEAWHDGIALIRYVEYKKEFITVNSNCWDWSK